MIPVVCAALVLTGTALMAFSLGKRSASKFWRKALVATEGNWRKALAATEAASEAGFKVVETAHNVHVGLLAAALDRAREDARALRERFRDQLDETAVPSERGN